jgi:hypothetical protein
MSIVTDRVVRAHDRPKPRVAQFSDAPSLRTGTPFIIAGTVLLTAVILAGVVFFFYGLIEAEKKVRIETERQLDRKTEQLIAARSEITDLKLDQTKLERQFYSKIWKMESVLAGRRERIHSLRRQNLAMEAMVRELTGGIQNLNAAAEEGGL